MKASKLFAPVRPVVVTSLELRELKRLKAIESAARRLISRAVPMDEVVSVDRSAFKRLAKAVL